MNDSGGNVAMPKLPAQITESQASVHSDSMNNQLGKTVQHSIGGGQGSRGVASYPPLSAGLGGLPAIVGMASNTSGLGADVPIDLYSTDTASGIVQVGSSPSFHTMR